MRKCKACRTERTPAPDGICYKCRLGMHAETPRRRETTIEDVATSAVVGAITGSSVIGGLVGGSFLGGLLGDTLEGTDDSIF